MSSHTIKCFGGGNLAMAVKRYFGEQNVSIYSKSINDRPLVYTDGDIILYLHTQSLRLETTAYDKSEVENEVKSFLDSIRGKKVGVYFFSSIAVNCDSPYGKMKMLYEKLLNNVAIIIRLPVIWYYETVRHDDKSTITNLSINYNNVETIDSQVSLSGHKTKPMPIYRLLYWLEHMFDTEFKPNIYELQGAHFFNYDEIIRYHPHISIKYGAGNGCKDTWFKRESTTNFNKTICIILAGGIGARFNVFPKQFATLNEGGKVVEITYARHYKFFDETYVVINEQFKDIQVNIPSENIIYAKTQSHVESVYRCLQKISMSDISRVAIVLANTPIIDVKLMFRCLSVQMTDDIVLVNGRVSACGNVTLTDKDGSVLNRNDIYYDAVRVYNGKHFSDIVTKCIEEGISDEYHYVLQKCKNNVKFVDVDDGVKPFKITYISDIYLINTLGKR